MYSATQLLEKLKENGIDISRPTLLNLMQIHPSYYRDGSKMYVDEVSFLEFFNNRLDVKRCIEVAKEYNVIFTKEEVRHILKHHPKMETSINGGKMFIKKDDFIETLKKSRNFKDPKEVANGEE